MKWIECNLPWEKYDISSDKKYPKYPDLGKKIKQLFGEDSIEFFDRNSKKIDKAYDLYYKFDEYGESKKKVKDHQELSEIEFLKKYYSDDKNVKLLIEYRELSKKIDDWAKEQFEVKKYEEDFKIFNEKENQKSFCGRGLNKVGTLIEIEIKNGKKKETKQFLIGDVNEIGGVCDDCVGFDTHNVIVKRYKVVWEKEKN